VIVAHSSDVISATATDAASVKSAHVASAKATHMASAKSTAHVATATASATASAGFCTRGKKAAGKHRARQNHHHSSFHDILHLVGRTYRLRTISDVVLPQGDFQRRDEGEIGMLICRLY
jgi:hypothetical protein